MENSATVIIPSMEPIANQQEHRGEVCIVQLGMLALVDVISHGYPKASLLCLGSNEFDSRCGQCISSCGGVMLRLNFRFTAGLELVRSTDAPLVKGTCF
jgi:hypothetical protein